MSASSSNPSFVCPPNYRSLVWRAALLMIFACPRALFATAPPETLPKSSKEITKKFVLQSKEKCSGYEFELIGRELNVKALGVEPQLRSPLKTYRFPSSIDKLSVRFSVLDVGQAGQVVIVTDASTSYTFAFVTQNFSAARQPSELRVQLALRGRLKAENRELRLFTNGKNIYLVDDAAPKICRRESSRIRRLDWQQVRFKSVRRSPLLQSERQGAKVLSIVEAQKDGWDWASLKENSPKKYSDGDFDGIAIPRQSQLYLGAEELAGQTLRLFFRNRGGDLFLNAGKELWRIPVEKAQKASKGNFLELVISFPAGDCFSLISGKKSPDVSEVFVSTQVEMGSNQRIPALVNGYLKGQVDRELLTFHATSIAERFLELWPSLSSKERELAVAWAFRMHPSIGTRLLLKGFTQGAQTKSRRYVSWLKDREAAVEFWIDYGLREPSTVRLDVLRLTLPTALEATYSAMARSISRQPAAVREGFRSLVWGSLDRPGARESYFDLSAKLLTQLQSSKEVDEIELRRGAVEWLRIGAQAPEISNQEYLPLLARLGPPANYREAYVLIEGNLERLRAVAQAGELDVASPLKALFQWSDLELSVEENISLHDRLFSELIVTEMMKGRFLGAAPSQGSLNIRPIIVESKGLSSSQPSSDRTPAFNLQWRERAQVGLRLGSPQLRSHIAEWLGISHAVDDLKALQELAQSDDWPNVRANALGALSQYPRAEFFEERQEMILSSLKEDPQLQVRRRAALTLSRFPSERTIEALFRVLKREEEVEVQAAAVRSLGKLCVNSAVEMLTSNVLSLNGSVSDAAELKLALASVSALHRLNPEDLKERMNQLDLSKVPGPYQAGLRAARATPPLCHGAKK